MIDEETKNKIRDLVEEEIRPRIQMDGGDIEFVGITEEDKVQVRLKGACVGCFAAEMTLKMGIENFLKIQFPQIVEVEDITNHFIDDEIDFDDD